MLSPKFSENNADINTVNGITKTKLKNL